MLNSLYIKSPWIDYDLQLAPITILYPDSGIPTGIVHEAILQLNNSGKNTFDYVSADPPSKVECLHCSVSTEFDDENEDLNPYKAIELMKCMGFMSQIGYRLDRSRNSVFLNLLYTLNASTENIVYLEYPENHIHPKLQNTLGKVISHEFSKGHEQQQFIIETHSSHLINSLRIAVKNHIIDSEDVKIFFLKRCNEKIQVLELSLDSRSQINYFPPNFMDQEYEEINILLDWNVFDQESVQSVKKVLSNGERIEDSFITDGPVATGIMSNFIYTLELDHMSNTPPNITNIDYTPMTGGSIERVRIIKTDSNELEVMLYFKNIVYITRGKYLLEVDGEFEFLINYPIEEAKGFFVRTYDGNKEFVQKLSTMRGSVSFRWCRDSNTEMIISKPESVGSLRHGTQELYACYVESVFIEEGNLDSACKPL